MQEKEKHGYRTRLYHTSDLPQTDKSNFTANLQIEQDNSDVAYRQLIEIVKANVQQMMERLVGILSNSDLSPSKMIAICAESLLIEVVADTYPPETIISDFLSLESLHHWIERWAGSSCMVSQSSAKLLY